MQEINIKNETDYNLPTCVQNQIISDAIEYFGDSIRTIRIQSGIERHTFNAKTCEVRFAFFVGDYNLEQLPILVSEDRPDAPHDVKFNGVYDSLLSSEFDDDEGVLAVIDEELEGVTNDDDMDLKVLDEEFNSIDPTDFDY